MMFRIFENPALVLREFPRGHPRFEDFVQLFQRTSLHLRHEQVEEYHAEKVGRCPNVAVLRALNLVSMRTPQFKGILTQFKSVGLMK